MASRPLIAPSILSADFSRLGEQIAEAQQHGANWIHIDVMDGHFVPPITMGQMVTETCRRITDLPLDVHLMVKDPDIMLKSFADAGADHIHVHIEASPNINESLEAIRALGCKAGIGINPETAVETLRPALGHADLILVMSVHPGYAGQDFIQEMLPKVAELRSMMAEIKSDAIIEMDGGIDHETLPLGLSAGAGAFVAASAVFQHPDGIAGGMQNLLSASLEAQNR
jgi:ribulose-phosphate 3-epimerase